MATVIYKILGKRGRTTIPFEIRQEAGFKYNDILSFTYSGDTVTVKKEKLCDGCKCSENESVMQGITLTEFLDELSPQQQQNAFRYLAFKLAKESDGG